MAATPLDPSFAADALSLFNNFFTALRPTPDAPYFSAQWTARVTEVSTSDPLLLTFATVLIAIVVTHTLHIITRNYSWVDRLWSITPWLFVWQIALFPTTPGASALADLIALQNPRLTALTVATTLWGLRLTYNFARKGGYDITTEDYRWGWLQKNVPLMDNPVVWQLFALFFIAGYQHALLWAIAVPPAWVAWKLAATAVPVWTAADTFACFVFLLAFVGETVGDNAQWDFQSRKWALIEQALSQRAGVQKKLANASTGDVGVDKQTMKEVLAGLPAPYSYGFATEGVFRWTRHLNFFCEQLTWWAAYLFTLGGSFSTTATTSSINLSTGELSIAGLGRVVVVNWTIIGAVVLTLLFQGTTSITEHITIQKYPLYKLYQHQTSRLMPWFPGRSMEELISVTQAYTTSRAPHTGNGHVKR